MHYGQHNALCQSLAANQNPTAPHKNPLRGFLMRGEIVGQTTSIAEASGVSRTIQFPEKKTLGKMSFQSTKSGGGEEFLLLGCRAKARMTGALVYLQTRVLDSY